MADLADALAATGGLSKAKRPPNLRGGDDTRRCGTCKWFRSRSLGGAGVCRLYGGYAVHADQLSDAYKRKASTMAKGKAQVRARGNFSPGTRVALIERYGDQPRLAGADIIDTGRVDDSGEVTFTGRPEGQRYWIVSQDEEDRRALAATSKLPTEGKERISDSVVRQRLAQTTAPRRRESGNIVTNPETKTKTVALTAGGLEYGSEAIGQPTDSKDRELEPQPRLRQEDAKNVPQRSATLTGSAHPVEAGEPQPHPENKDFHDVPQRSATEFGQATPVAVVPDSQEDAKRLKQRSATEDGEAKPKPKGDPVYQALSRDASVKQAAGVDKPDQGEPPTKASEGPKKTPSTKPAKASQAKSETKQAVKKDASVRRAVRKQADSESDN